MDLRQSIGLTADSIFYAGGGWGFQKFPLCEAGYASVLDKLRFRQSSARVSDHTGFLVSGVRPSVIAGVAWTGSWGQRNRESFVLQAKVIGLCG